MTSPLQSLSVRGARRHRASAAADFEGLRRSRSCPAEAALSLLRRHSRGVDGFFRVCRARLAAHWFAAPTSTSPSLDAGPCRLRRTRWPVANASGRVSPRELHLSLGAPGLSPGLPPVRPQRRVVRSQASSLEVAHPSSARGTKRPPTTALPQPLRSVLAVSHDLDGLLRSAPPRDLPGWHSWGPSSFRVFPAARWAPPSPAAQSPLDLASAAPRLRGHPAVETTFCVLPRCAFRVFPALRPYPPASGFPLAGDRPPRGLLFWNLASAVARRRPRPSGSRHVPTCQ